MKKILLLQFRDDISKDHEFSCILDKTGLDKNSFVVINSILDEFDDIPEILLKDIGLVILGASGQYDLSKNQEPIFLATEKTKNLIKYIIANDFPTLGICFGHQFLAQELGAKVLPVTEMAESGTLLVNLTAEGKNDKLFSKLPNVFSVQLGHKESVTEPPAEFVILMSSHRCQVQAFRFKNNLYGVQFHPELSADDIAYRWSLYPEYIKGKDLVAMRKELKDTPEAAEFLKDFVTHFISG